MSNTLTAFNAEYWANEMQVVFHRENRAKVLANTELRDVLVDGTRVHKPYRGPLAAQDYTKGTDITTFNDLASTDEYLDVNTTKIVPFYVDDLDKIQNKWDSAAIYARDAQRLLNNLIDQAVLGEYSNARNSITAGDLGGSGTGSATVNSANIANVFAVASRTLQRADVPSDDQVAVIGPRFLETLRLSLAGRETGFGDKVGMNGVVGNRFGFELILSNNIPFTAVFTSSDAPSNSEYIYIDGVKFTFVSGDSDSAGEVKIGTEAETYASLVQAINNTGTAGASNYCAVSDTNRRRLTKGSVTASFETHTLTVSGYGDVAVSEAASNVVITSNSNFPLFMKRGAIDLVLQKVPSVEFRAAEKRLGKYIYPWMVYGKKTFEDMKDAMVYLNMNTASWL